ncbi:MAG: hypothetical protein FJ267_11160, partial [Planctomycetes bacterium]|nr:hypothetical protein [Planctomycetota bacterium]
DFDFVSRAAQEYRQVTFSLDLKNGQILRADSTLAPWNQAPIEIVREVIQRGVTRLIVLDLADVGMGNGTGTNLLCQNIRNEFPSLHLTSGGGIRGIEDLLSWQRLGIDRVLVATALHNGSLTHEEILSFRKSM